MSEKLSFQQIIMRLLQLLGSTGLSDSTALQCAGWRRYNEPGDITAGIGTGTLECGLCGTEYSTG